MSEPRWRRALPLVVAIVGSLVGVYVILELWNASLNVPFQYHQDAIAYANNVSQVSESHTLFNDPRFAAPFVQHFQDWPSPDVLPLAVCWFIGLFTSQWATVVNVFFLVTFPTVAAAAWWVLRKIGVGAWTATVLALLYNFLPYHFIRGENHLFLASYFAIPLGVFLAWSVLRGENLWESKWVSLRTVLFALATSTSDTYYAAFVLVLLFAAALSRSAVLRNTKALFAAIGLALILVGTVFVDTLPATIYHHEHGSNALLGDRNAGEITLFGLRISDMVLPVEGHRISALADKRAEFDSTTKTTYERESAALGIVATVGFIWLLCLLFIGLIKRHTDPMNDRHRQLALLAGISTIVASLGGFAPVIGLLFGAEIRSWARMAIVIGFLALAAVGLLLDVGFAKLRQQKRAAFVPFGLVAILLIGSADQTSPTEMGKDISPDGAQYKADRAFFGQIESTMPKGASIFQLPIMRFPEAVEINGVSSSDPLRPYLSTKNLKWSFGGVHGRIGGLWQDRLANPEIYTTQFLNGLISTGFTGLYIDRDGYTDHANALESRIQTLTNTQPTVGQDGRGAFYDLRQYAASHPVDGKLRDRLLFPAYTSDELDGFFTKDVDGTKTYWATQSATAFDLIKSSDVELKTHISFDVRAQQGSSAFSVRWPDGQIERLTVTTESQTITHDVGLKSKINQVEISSAAPQLPIPGETTRKAGFELSNLSFSTP